MSHIASETLTHVELTWIEKKIEHWIRFGHDVEEKIGRASCRERV